MKRVVLGLIATALLVSASVPALANGPHYHRGPSGFRAGVYFGPGPFFYGPYRPYYYPPAYYPPPPPAYYYPPPAPVYVPGPAVSLQFGS
jgi:hypothetical protein